MLLRSRPRLAAAAAAAAGSAAAAYALAAPQPLQAQSPSPKLARTASVIGGFFEQPWSPPPRDDVIKGLKSKEYDILVIGGGATGTGVAMDAATRGLNVALVERDDFAAGTSSRSTKLIHGGIRYLAQAFQTKLPPNTLLDIVWNLRLPIPGTEGYEYLKILNADLYERKYMIDSAGFMTTPLPIMVPMYRWWEVPFLFIAGKMYDFIAGRRRSVPPSHYISAAEVLYQFPEIKEQNHEGCTLKGALVFNEGQQNDTRMNVHIALTAAQEGAAVANHTEVVSLLSTGTFGSAEYKITGAKVRDVFTNEVYNIKAKQVISACGVFSDAVRKMADPDCTDIMVAGPGSHLVMPDYTSPDKMGFLWFTEDGRVLYLLPWEGSTLAGTTDAKGDVTDLPQTTMADVDFILGECNRVCKEPLDYSHVKAAWAGLRPLVRDPNADPNDTKKLSRDHVVDVRPGGLVSICGGKWTTYRAMAQDAIDKALEINPSLKATNPAQCSTLSMTLIGSDRSGQVCGGKFDKVTVMLRENFDLDKAVAEHLRHNYGTRALALAKMAFEENDLVLEVGGTRFPKRLSNKHSILEAEVIFACRQEYACTAVDVLARRTRIAFLDANAAVECLPRVIELMARELKWSSKRKEQEGLDALKFLETMYMPASTENTAEDVVNEVLKRGANKKLVRTVTRIQ